MLGFWGGAREFFDDREKQKIRREEFLAEQLNRTKAIVIPELLDRIGKEKTKVQERKDRVSQGVLLGLSRKTALAMEKTGQLEFEMEKLGKLGAGKVSAEYIERLDTLVQSRLDPEDDKYDEKLSRAVAAGLDQGSLSSEEDQLKGLVAAINATEPEEFNQSIIDMLPATSEEGSDFNKIPYATARGERISETRRNRINTMIARNLKDILGAEYVVSGTGDMQIFQFSTQEHNKVLNSVVNDITDNFIEPGLITDDNTIIDMAVQATADYVDYRKQTQQSNTIDPDHFNYFSDVFDQGLATDTMDYKDIWASVLSTPVPNPTLEPCPPGYERNPDTGQCELQDINPDPRRRRQPTPDPNIDPTTPELPS